MRVFAFCIVLMLCAAMPLGSDSLDADSLADLVGYTIVAASHVRGDFEGADYDKPVALDNGMIFEFTEYSYTYSYRPTAVVLAKTYSAEQVARLRVGRSGPVTLYKLIVEDEIYDVRRLR